MHPERTPPPDETPFAPSPGGTDPPVAGRPRMQPGRPVPEGVRWYKSIKSKIILCVAITTLAANGFFTFLYLDVQARHLDETILNNATQLSETIRKSIQYDMLGDRQEHAYRIMETIAEQEGIEKVRIYGSEGTILFSTDKGERGTLVDKKAEG